MTDAPLAGDNVKTAHCHPGGDVPATAMPRAGSCLAWVQWIVLALGVALAIAAGILMERGFRQEARIQFALIGRDKADQIQMRITSYVDALYALRGLFAASTQVTREDFRNFGRALDVAERYSGLGVMAYSPLVARADRLDFEQAVRAEQRALMLSGAPFKIAPAGADESFLPVTYLEPFDRNRRLWGVNLLAQPERRAAVERARDGGGIGTTTAIESLADNGTVKTTLLRLAIYRGGRVPSSVSERRRLFTGVVSLSVQAEELVRATFPGNALS